MNRRSGMGLCWTNKGGVKNTGLEAGPAEALLRPVAVR
jgi:hypothetical protein